MLNFAKFLLTFFIKEIRIVESYEEGRICGIMDENQKVLIEQYKAYIDHKEQFIERSLKINRFYMVVVIVLALILFAVKAFVDNGTPVVLTAAVAGMCASLLWFLNQDGYSYLIKIKLSNVIEAIEKQLPMQIYSLEYESIKKRNEETKAVAFTDVQKIIAIASCCLFFAAFVFEIGQKYVTPAIVNIIG